MSDARARFAQEAAVELERAMRGMAPLPASPAVSLIDIPRQVLSDKAAKNLRTMVFVSDSGGEPHIVTRLEIGAVVCTCPAMRSIEHRPTGCWAMKDFRAITGMEQP